MRKRKEKIGGRFRKVSQCPSGASTPSLEENFPASPHPTTHPLYTLAYDPTSRREYDEIEEVEIQGP